jgi:hypothetical protein
MLLNDHRLSRIIDGASIGQQQVIIIDGFARPR